MAYLPGSCKWNDIVDNDSAMLRNNLVIDRNALQIMQPLNADGELQCERQKFPRIDFASGYPEFWLLYQTEVKMPSEHTQDGKRYDAEIQLDHVYEADRQQREIGKVAIFLDGHSSASKWDFLDKLICQWREVEDKTREDCCLGSVPPYPGCRNPTRLACGETTDSDTPASSKPTVTVGSDPGTTLDPVTTTPEPITTADFSSTTLDPDATSHIITASGAGAFRNSANKTFSCSLFPDVTYDRMCKDNGCCQNPRQAGKFCHTMYETFGDDMHLACNRCCATPKEVGPPAPDHPVYPRIQCSSVPQSTSRICKSGGCCDGSNGIWCQILQSKYTKDEMTSICWYCCSEPKDIGATLTTSDFITTGLGPATNAHLVTTTLEPATTASPLTALVAAEAGADAFRSKASFVCKAHTDVNYERMCKDDGCCQNPRQAGNFCHGIYEKFGDDMPFACNRCCETPKDVGPPAPDHPVYPRIQCSNIPQSTSRICKSGGCCDDSNGTWCQILRAKYTKEEMSSICWYCCSEPKDIGHERSLLSGEEEVDAARGTEDLFQRIQIDDTNFDEKDELEDTTEELNYDELDEMEDTQRRLVNFDDIQYLAYNWLQKVKTEVSQSCPCATMCHDLADAMGAPLTHTLLCSTTFAISEHNLYLLVSLESTGE